MIRARTVDWKWRGRRLKAWPYAHGYAQNVYLWLNGWTIHVAVIRRVRDR